MDGWTGLTQPRDDEQETTDMKHSLFGFRPTRHLALGLGAAGLVLGASGATAAATALIQPAGALSVQVPAVAVREQNVNSAGRIRVALPKTSVGVNGTVAVSNLPVNSAGRVQTQNGNGTAELAQTSWGATFSSAPTVLVDVTGSGIFKGANLSDFANSGCLAIQGSIDGMGFYYQINAAMDIGGNSAVLGGSVSGGQARLWFMPPGGLPFHHSLLVEASYACGGTTTGFAQAFYTLSA